MQNPLYTLKNYLINGFLLFFISLLCNIVFALNKTNDFKLNMPIDCDYGVNCYIQNYVDLNSSNSYVDYNCGFLSYDYHKGTDFRLLDYQQMTTGIKVIVAAEGIVKAIRNNEDDFVFIKYGQPSVQDKECGNGIVVAHQNGYATQYCHLLKNSIIVKVGQKIKVGDKIGYVGMSGHTEFPHLHLSVTKNDEIIDPFTNLSPSKEYSCHNQNNINSLWDKKTEEKLKYIETAILNFHVTSEIPTELAARAGNHREDQIALTANKIILWADIMGVLKNDKIIFELTDEQGNNFFQYSQVTPKKYVLYFLYSGKKLNSIDNIKPGNYIAKISLYRNNNELLSKIKSIKLI